MPPDAGRYLVYLTPRESLTEVQASAALLPESHRGWLFRVQWQDLLIAATNAAPSAPEPARTILADVARFLRTLGLEYFDRFTEVELAPVPDDLGSFYRPATTGFRGWEPEPGLTMMDIHGGRWV